MRGLTVARRRRDERGMTAILVALSFTAMLAAAGLGIDSASLVFQRSRVQHSADAAAIAIAIDCVASKSTCSNATGPAGAKGTADYYATQNAETDGTASVPGGVSPGAGTVQVKVDKSVPTNFFRAFGIESKTVSAQSRVSWANHPTGGPVIPFAISLCEYKRVALGTPTFIRTDIEAKVLAPVAGKLTESVAYPALDPNMLKDCAVPTGVSLPGSPNVVTTLRGGLWLSDNGSSTNNGNLISTTTLDLLNGGYNFEMNQPEKFKTHFAVGQTMLMAIYAPTINYPHAGLKTSGSGATETTSGEIRLQLIGYAPFIPTGWCLGDKQGNLGGCGGAAPSTTGIAGKFTSTTRPIAGFNYGSAGGGFGASLVKLTD